MLKRLLPRKLRGSKPNEAHSGLKVRVDMKVFRASKGQWFDLPPVGNVPWLERVKWWFRLKMGYSP